MYSIRGVRGRSENGGGRRTRKFQAPFSDHGPGDTEGRHITIDQIVEACLCLAGLLVVQGNWLEAITALDLGWNRASWETAQRFEDAPDLIGAFFALGINLELRREQAKGFCLLYAAHNGLAALGESMVKHFGSIHRSGEPFPHADSLEDWLSARELAGADLPEFRLPLRLLCVGVEFLKSKSQNRAILLDLTAPERSLLEQTFGLE